MNKYSYVPYSLRPLMCVILGFGPGIKEVGKSPRQPYKAYIVVFTSYNYVQWTGHLMLHLGLKAGGVPHK